MATIRGGLRYVNGRMMYLDTDDSLYGGSDQDFIYGNGGNDKIFAGAGNDIVYGGTGDDQIYAGRSAVSDTYAWGNDWVAGGAGNDSIFYGNSLSSVVIYGDDYADSDNYAASASDGRDIIYGGHAGDEIHGGGGNDLLFGGAGNDAIHGNDGDDRIAGGIGGDEIWGDYGRNTFVYAVPGESSATDWLQADSIMDWYGPWDSIDLATAGKASNYFEQTFNSGSRSIEDAFAQASGIAANHLKNNPAPYIFLTDGKNGYLFADTDGNYRVDTGIEFRGVTSLSQFSYADIV